MRKLLLFLVLAAQLLGCGGGEGNRNTFEVDIVPSTSDLTLRFTEPLPEGADALRLTGYAPAPEEHDHAHREAEETHDHQHEELVAVYGPETRAVAAEILFQEVPTNVVEVDIELLDEGVEIGHGHVEVRLSPGGSFILEDPPLEAEES